MRPVSKGERLALVSAMTRDFLKQYERPKKPWRPRKAHRASAGNPILTAPPVAEPERLQSVYVIGAGGPLKIGFASDIWKRLAALQTGSPHRLEVFFQAEVRDAPAVERECHRRLAAKRLSGEWFDVGRYEAIDLVRSVVAEFEA